MTERELFRQTFDALHASGDTVTEVMKMAKANNRSTNRKRKHPVRTFAFIAAAAAALMTTALATDIFGLRAEPVGEYGLAVSAGAVAFDGGETAPVGFPDVAIEARWLPDGMAPGDYKYSFEDTPNQGGFSVSKWVLNTGKATFCQVVEDAESQEMLTVNGREAIFVQCAQPVGIASVGFDKYLYISYPELNLVLDIRVGEDVDRDTALRFAENLSVTGSVTPVGEDDGQMAYLSGLYEEAAAKASGKTPSSGGTLKEKLADFIGGSSEMDFTATAGEMANVHRIGESFTWRCISADTYLPVKVTEVSVGDDTSVLRDVSYLNDDVAAVLDEDGKLPMNTVRYIRSGDGINAPTQTVVAERQSAQKFVAVTLEITNDTDGMIDDVCYYPCLLPIAETAEGYVIYEPEPENGAEYDYTVNSSVASIYDMCYYDSVDAASDGGNHVRNLAPGETAEIQVAFVVNADMLDTLYLDMTYCAGCFVEEHLETGYVDLALN